MKQLAQDTLLVVVGIQHDGAAYQLDALTRHRLQEQRPSSTRLRSVFLGHQRAAEFPQLHAPHWETVVRLLTDFSDEQIAEMGGARLYSPETDKVLWEWKPQILNCQGQAIPPRHLGN
jgi:hypothetical protein